MKKATAFALALGLALSALVVGASLTGTNATPTGPVPGDQAAACRCPLIYAPVICDHDRTYPNQCVADCHHAKNCVPTGEF